MTMGVSPDQHSALPRVHHAPTLLLPAAVSYRV